jgi:DNA-binding NarL/FixJ family response regulator
VIRVLLVDDQQLVRLGLARILRPRAGFEVVEQCATGDAALAAVDLTHPDVVLMDIRMPGMDGIEATRRLRNGRDDPPPVLVLTTFDDDDVLHGALAAGADGFILKDAPGEDILRATRVVAQGGAWLDPTVIPRVLDVYRATGPRIDAKASVGTLTERELEVLRLVATGATNPEIAKRLVISEATVKSHIGRIFTKLALRDRPAAIIFAYECGLITPGT